MLQKKGKITKNQPKSENLIAKNKKALRYF